MLPQSTQDRASRTTRLARRLLVSSSAIGLAVMACHDAPTAPIPELTPGREAMRITCEADVRRQVIACAPGDSAPPAASSGPGMAANIIFGTQGSTAKLTSSNVAYAGEVFSFNTTVQNLIGQPIGTLDGSTLASGGVRVFFNVWPYATSGTGTIDFINPGDAASLVDGYATFTAANQPYYQYNQVLATNATSSAKQWRMHVPSTVLTFKFRVLIDAPVQYEDGWIDVSPAATQLRPTQATTLTGIVRDVYGATVPGAVIAWASSATGVATVNASTGEVTAVADGQATITATSGLRSGRATITVATPSAAQTTITASPPSPQAGSAATITVQVKSASGGNVTTSGDAVVLSADGGTLGSVSYAGNGQYTATLNSTSATTIHVTGTLNGSAIGNPATVTFVPGAPAVVSKQAGDNQSAGAGTAVATAPSVKVTDANGNAIAGVSVTFAVGSGGGSVTGGSQVTNASGIATVGSWTLGTTPGTNNNTLVATAGALSATFTASANGPAAIEIMAGDAQTAAVGAAVSTAPSVRVKDASGTPLPGVTVTFAVTGGNGSVTGASATTNASGIATVGSWTLGAGGASCSAAAITSCTRNALSATATGGSAPSTSFKGYVPPFVPSTASYQAVGNATLSIAAGTGALKDAYSINGDGANGTGATLSIVNASATGSASGNVSFTQATGAFTYLSAPGYTNGAATETFSYSVTDGRATTNTSATLAVNVPTRVWYVRPGYASTATGSENSPYRDFSATAGVGVEATGVSAANDVILVQTGSGTATGGTLKSGQVVYGQGASAAYSHTFPGSPSTYRNGGTSVALLAAGSAPTVGALVLGSGNTLRGLTINPPSGTALSGTNFGVLAVSEVTINASAAALDLTTGALSGSFAAVSSAGGTNNVRLSGVGSVGVFPFGSGLLSGATGDGFVVSGGSGTFTYTGGIANTTSYAVNISGMTAGGVTLSGNLNASTAARGYSLANNSGGTFTFSGVVQNISSGAVAGVNLTNNTGATINFAGGSLTISTTTGNGFSANGGGTISVTGSGNTIVSTGGTALTVNNTTIGSSGLTFRTISANGGSNGIFLANTGSSGGLTVAGTGAVGSGGTIQNITGANGSTAGVGVYVSTSANLSLSNMNLSGMGNYGILASNLSGTSSLTRVRITGTNGDAAGEGGASFTQLTGSMTIQNSRFEGGATNNLRVVNTSGTLNRLTISQDTIGLNGTNTLIADDALHIKAGTGTLNATIQNTRFLGSYKDQLQFDAAGTGTHDLVVQNNTFNNGYAGPHGTGGAIDVIADTAGTSPSLTYLISGNSITSEVFNAIAVEEGRANANMVGTISSNTIGTPGNATSGTSAGSGIYIRQFGPGTHRVKVSSNGVYGINGSAAILATTGASDGTETVTNASLHFKAVSNTIANLRSDAGAQPYVEGIKLDHSQNSTVCAQIGGSGLQNNLTNAAFGGSTGGGAAFTFMQNPSNASPLAKFVGYSAAGSNIGTMIQSANTGVSNTSTYVYTEVTAGTVADATAGTGTACNFVP